jgi:hypothetical protein
MLFFKRAFAFVYVWVCVSLNDKNNRCAGESCHSAEAPTIEMPESFCICVSLYVSVHNKKTTAAQVSLATQLKPQLKWCQRRLLLPWSVLQHALTLTKSFHRVCVCLCVCVCVCAALEFTWCPFDSGLCASLSEAHLCFGPTCFECDTFK